MKLPTETLLDCFRCLDRPSLDAVQFTSKRFRYAVDKLTHVCLRFLLFASISSDYFTKTRTWLYTIRARRKRAAPKDVRHELTKKMVTTEESAGEYFAKFIISSFVERTLIECVRLTDRMLQAVQPILPNVHVARLLILEFDAALVSPNVFVETVAAFGSIRDFLRIAGVMRMKPGYINDALVNYAVRQGTREVELQGQGECDVTDESILNFLKAPSGGPGIRKLEISRPRLSPQFLERLVEAHQSGLIGSNVIVNLWKVTVRPPDANGPLRFTVADTYNGSVTTFARGIKLVAKFGPKVISNYWRQSIEYDGREAALQKVS